MNPNIYGSEIIPEKLVIKAWSSNTVIDISLNSTDVNLTGEIDPETNLPTGWGFYIVLMPDGTEGTLRVKFLNDIEATIPIFKGYNPVYVKEIIAGHIDNTVDKIMGVR